MTAPSPAQWYPQESTPTPPSGQGSCQDPGEAQPASNQAGQRNWFLAPGPKEQATEHRLGPMDFLVSSRPHQTQLPGASSRMTTKECQCPLSLEAMGTVQLSRAGPSAVLTAHPSHAGADLAVSGGGSGASPGSCS